MTADLKEVADAGVPLFCGRITIPIEPLPKEQWENTPTKNPYWHKQWYHDMTVWLAPGYFYVSVLERTGHPVMNPQARPGIPPRFLPEGRAPQGVPQRPQEPSAQLGATTAREGAEPQAPEHVREAVRKAREKAAEAAERGSTG
jgi:hypothetical protein